MDEHQLKVFCRGCERELWLEADGEFLNGLWRNKSRLIFYGENNPDNKTNQQKGKA